MASGFTRCVKTNKITHHVELLKLGTGQSLREVLSLKEGLDLNAGLVLSGQRPLRLLNLTTQLLHGAVVFAHVFACLLLVQFDEVLHDALVEVLTSQVSVAVRGHDFEHAIVDGQEGDVKGATAQIKHKDVLLAVPLVQTISNGSRSSTKKQDCMLLKKKKKMQKGDVGGSCITICETSV